MTCKIKEILKQSYNNHAHYYYMPVDFIHKCMLPLTMINSIMEKIAKGYNAGNDVGNICLL